MTSSKDYWAARERAQQEVNKKLDAKFDKELKKIYDAALANVQQEIDAFYGRYATKEGISLAEAKKRVNQLDIEAYEAKAKEYVANRTFTKQANEEMRLYNLTMKVNRLEMLKSRIGMELAAKYSEMERKAAKHLQSGAEDEFKRMAGILGKSVPNAKKAASTIPGASFHNATYSDRIWTNQRALKSEIDKLLQEGMIQGRNPKALAPQLQRVFGVSRVASERLMRTEMCRVQIEAQRQSYDENGIDEYEYMAHAGCCEICAAMNGKVFKVKKMVVGDNAPPLHPNCRCGTVPHMDMEAYEEWLDGYKDHGLSFEEWKKQVAYVSHHTVNYAKAIDNISANDNFGKIGFTKEELLEEAQKSAAGRQVIKALRNSEFRAVITSQIDLFDPYARGSSYEDENVVYLHVPNIKSKVVAAQTLIHEYIHIHYHIGGCQHAEAICFAYEKMHIMNRDYLYEDEWNYVKKLAVDNYNGHWEKGGYGNFEQFDFVRRRKEK